ncbi:MAG: class I SAM-dependent methyltransferase [Rhodospirillaceae bacterium]|nr:class I SAM-dependent methyltransferase [Rhodospirillaceae bacterium]
MSELLEHLKKRVAAEGPLLVADYMSEALANPKHGYYMTGDPLGKSGDFITAPEISQMFGELIGLWCAITWNQMGSPSKINLIEMGPGRGTLMVDAIRALVMAPQFLDAIDIHMIETSPSLQKRQRRNLDALDVDIQWHKSFADVPEGPFILVANELLDALPIRQFEKSVAGWGERKVGCNEAGELHWMLDQSAAVPEAFIPAALADSPPGSIFEFSPAGVALVTSIAGEIAKYGGAALFIDYGHTPSGIGDTLQAVKDHKFHDVLCDPGEADLTAHVDFEQMAENARAAGALAYGAITQRDFLRPLGIEHRAKQLKKIASTGQMNEVFSGLNRLIGEDEMGTLFKVLALTHPDMPMPEGFGYDNDKGE